MKVRPHVPGEQYFIVPTHGEKGTLVEFDEVTKRLDEKGEETTPPGASFRTSPLPMTLMRLRETVVWLRIQDWTHTVIFYKGKRLDTFQITREGFAKFMEHREQVPFDFTPYHRTGKNGEVHIYTVRPTRALKLKGWRESGKILSGAALLKRQTRG